MSPRALRSLYTSLAPAALLLAFAATARAEEPALRRGRVELSTALSLDVIQDRGEDETLTSLVLPVRAGYFVTRNLSLEGELALSHVGLDDFGDETGVRFSGSALYHFNPAGRVAPFLLAGAGVGNGVDFFNGVIHDQDTTVTSLSAGAGLKAFVSDRAAFRLEYRFTRVSFEEDGFGGFEPRSRQQAHLHRVFAGISLFFQ